MEYNPEIHHRRSIRLKGYDYSQDGAYFITICTKNKECLFGEILDREMILNDAGEMMQKWWKELGNKFLNFELDVFVVMPNHFHAIVVINNDSIEADLCVCPEKNNECIIQRGEHIGSPLPDSSLYKMIQWFKTMTTNEYIRGVKSGKFPSFEKSIWQRNYYEHIIRNEKSLENIQNYIIYNPQEWKEDDLFVE